MRRDAELAGAARSGASGLHEAGVVQERHSGVATMTRLDCSREACLAAAWIPWSRQPCGHASSGFAAALLALVSPPSAFFAASGFLATCFTREEPFAATCFALDDLNSGRLRRRCRRSDVDLGCRQVAPFLALAVACRARPAHCRRPGGHLTLAVPELSMPMLLAAAFDRSIIRPCDRDRGR
jgi:hypothetical protein